MLIDPLALPPLNWLYVIAYDGAPLPAVVGGPPGGPRVWSLPDSPQQAEMSLDDPCTPVLIFAEAPFASLGRPGAGRAHYLLAYSPAGANGWTPPLARYLGPCDVNGDGVLDSRDFFDFLQDFYAANPGADYDGNGSVDSQDFFGFARDWQRFSSAV